MDADDPRYPAHWEADVVLADGGVAHVRPARTGDVRAIRALVEPLVARRVLVAKDAVAYFEGLQQFRVAEAGGRLVGCGALHVMWEDLAEVRTLAVDPAVARHGVGGRLLDAISSVAAKRGVGELRTAARWNDHAMLRWFDQHGFVLAPNHVVERAIDGTAIEAPVDAPVFVDAGRGPGGEVDYGAPGGNDYERLARDTCEVSAMQPSDLAEIVRIDRGLTGRDRSGYIGRKLAEAMDESGVRVSLAARLDGAIVGFVMARADLGDFGRTDPSAVLDTIGVDREYEHRGVGHALLSQLCLNLAALRIERIETVVAPRDLGLLGFLYDVGFVPSQRIPFVRAIA